MDACAAYAQCWVDARVAFDRRRLNAAVACERCCLHAGVERGPYFVGARVACKRSCLDGRVPCERCRANARVAYEGYGEDNHN